MKFAVISFEPISSELHAEIMAIDQGAYVSYRPNGVYFVKFPGTATTLAAKLRFSSVSSRNSILGLPIPEPETESSSRTGVVLKVHEYFGYGNGDLWTWLKE